MFNSSMFHVLPHPRISRTSTDNFVTYSANKQANRQSEKHGSKQRLLQYNIRLLEAVRTQRRTIIEREKYVENENVKMVHNE